MLKRIRDFLFVGPPTASYVAIIGTIAIAFGIGINLWFYAYLVPAIHSAPPSVAAPAAPLQPSAVTIDGHVISIPPGSTFEYTSDTSKTGGVLTEDHQRRSTGTGAGLHTATEGGAVGFTGGSAPNSSLGADDTAGATGGSSGSLKQTFAGGLNLCQLAAIACAGFAVYFITRKPPNKVAAIHCAICAGGLWYAGEHPWILIVVVLVGLAVLAWKARMLGSAQGAIDALWFGAKQLGGSIASDLHGAAHGVAESNEKPFIDASKQREGA